MKPHRATFPAISEKIALLALFALLPHLRAQTTVVFDHAEAGWTIDAGCTNNATPATVRNGPLTPTVGPGTASVPFSFSCSTFTETLVFPFTTNVAQVNVSGSFSVRYPATLTGSIAPTLSAPLNLASPAEISAAATTAPADFAVRTNDGSTVSTNGCIGVASFTCRIPSVGYDNVKKLYLIRFSADYYGTNKSFPANGRTADDFFTLTIIVYFRAPEPADLAISYIQPVQVVHNFPPLNYVNDCGSPSLPGCTGNELEYKIHELPLIVNKPTMVRVFVKSRGAGAKAVAGVGAVLRGHFTDTLSPTRPNPLDPDDPNPLTTWNRATITAQPYNGPIPLADPPDFMEQTLDFQLPDAWLRRPGIFSFEVEIVLPPGVQDSDLSNNKVNRGLILNAQPSGPRPADPQRLVIGYVPICVPGPPNPNCPGPRIGTLTRFLTDTFPIRLGGLDYFPAGPEQHSDDDITTDQGWDDCLKIFLRPLFERFIQNIHRRMDFLVGFVPSGIGGVPAAAEGQADSIRRHGEGHVALVTDHTRDTPPTENLSAEAVGHEIAHLMGMRHVPYIDAGCALQADDECPNWPYGDNPRLQFPGYDFANHRLKPSNGNYDLMSYCQNADSTNIWVSPYTYRALFDHQLATSPSPTELWASCHDPRIPRPNSLPGPALVEQSSRSQQSSRPSAGPQQRRADPSDPPQEYLLVSGSARSDGSGGSLNPAFHLTTWRQPLASDQAGNHCLRFHSASGSSLGDYCFTLDFINSESGHGLSRQGFSFLVAPPGGTAGISLLREGNPIASLSGGPQPPTLSITSPQPGSAWQSGSQNLVWSGAGSGSGALSYIVDYSDDGGASWLPVSTPSVDSQLAINPAGLNGGSNVFFRVQASDGLNTSTAQVGPITIVQAPRASATPNSVDFRNTFVPIGVQRQVTLTNSGSGPLHVNSVQMNSPAFQLVSPAVPFTVASGGDVTLELRFTPAATGQTQGSMTISSDATNNPALSVPLLGNGISTTAPDAAVTPATLDFGNVAAGATKSLDVTLQNFGPADLNVSSVSVTGSAFKLANPPGAFTLTANATQAITVQFAAPPTGAQTGSLSINTDDPAHPTLTVALRATVTGGTAPGAAGVISVTPASLDFGSLPVGQSKDLTVSIANTGGAALNVSSTTVFSDTSDPSQFGVSGSTALSNLAPGARQNVTVTFKPNAAGAQSAILQILSNDLNQPIVKVALTGIGTAAGAPTISAPSTLEFGSAAVGQSKDATLTLRNTGTAPLIVQSVSVSGAQFSFVSSIAPPLTIAPSGQRAIPLRMTPIAAGPQVGLVTITSNDTAHSPATVNLTGTGTAPGGPAPGLTITPTSLDFGTEAPGQSKSLTLDVRNTGSSFIVVLGINAIGPVSPAFNINPSDFFMAPGDQVTVTVRFSPTDAGAQTEKFSFASSDAASSSVVISLSGNSSGGTPSCAYSLSATSNSVPATGGTGTVGVTASAGCPAWTAVSNAPFITVTSGVTGTSPVGYTVAANTGAARSGTLTIAGLTYTVTQAAAPTSAGPDITTGLISWWKFDETSGPTARDSIGPNDGTIIGTAGWTPGRIGGALNFNGSTYVAGAGAGTGFPVGAAARTIAAWVKTSSPAPADNAIFHYGTIGGSPAAVNFHLFLYGPPSLGKAGLGNGYGFGIVAGTTNVGDSAWHLVVGVYDGAGGLARIYVDGVQQVASPLATTPNTGAGTAWRIGLFQDGGQPFIGALDEVRIYNRALSPGDVQALFTAAGDSPSAPILGPTPASLDFGSVTVGQNTTRTLTLSNTGAGALNVTALTAGGAFSVVSPGVPFQVAAGAAATVTLRFAPTTATPQSGTLSIATDAGARQVSLTGTGTAVSVPQIAVSPSTLDFGTVTVGQDGSLAVSVSNTGAATLNVTNLTAGGAFSVVSPGVPFAVTAGASATVTVRFSPTSIGAQSATLAIASNDPARGSLTVTLSGTGGAAAPSSNIIRTLAYHEITRLPREYQLNNGPVISANGNRVVFVDAPGPEAQRTNHIYVVNADGTGLTQLDSYVQQCYCGAFMDISADGSRVVSTDGYQLRIAGTGGARQLTNRPSITNVKITADGSRVFFSFLAGAASPSDPTTERGVYVINADGSGLRQVVRPSAIAAALGVTADRVGLSSNGPGLDVSANATRIIFGVNANGQDHLFAANADGSGLHELLPGITFMNHAVLSADGSRIGYNVTPPGAANQIGVINFDGSGRRVLATNLDAGPTFSITGDGALLLAGGTGRLYSTNGSGVVQLQVLGDGPAAPLIYDTLKRPTMNAAGNRVVYEAPDSAGFDQLVMMEINPASLGSAPKISDAALSPGFVSVSGATRSTLTVSVSTAVPLLIVDAQILFNGLPDVGIAPFLLHDAAGDGVFTTDRISAGSSATRGAHTIRIKAEVKDAAGVRHATAIEFGTLDVQP